MAWCINKHVKSMCMLIGNCEELGKNQRVPPRKLQVSSSWDLAVTVQGLAVLLLAQWWVRVSCVPKDNVLVLPGTPLIPCKLNNSLAKNLVVQEMNKITKIPLFSICRVTSSTQVSNIRLLCSRQWLTTSFGFPFSGRQQAWRAMSYGYPEWISRSHGQQRQFKEKVRESLQVALLRKN